MTKKISKIVAVIAVALVMAISTMTVVVSAATINKAAVPKSVEDSWAIAIGNGPDSDKGIVYGLVNVVDNGITFRCDGYYTGGVSGLYAYGQITNPNLRADYASGAILDYIGDIGTDSFRRGWYDINGSGNVEYYVQAYGYTLGFGQYINGIAV